MAVGPVDLHALALGDLHAHLLRGDADAGQRTLDLALTAFVVFGSNADAFVAHKVSLQQTAKVDSVRMKAANVGLTAVR